MEEESEKDIVISEADDEELIVFAIEENVSLSGNNNKYGSPDGNNNDVTLSLHDWLADSATTAHITNQRDCFVEYQTTPELTVAGVGNVTTTVKGKGVIILSTEC